MVCRRREFWVSRNRRRRPGKNLKDLLSVWNVAVETVNNCVFEAFSLTGIFGVRHFLRESADFLTRKLPRAEVFADEFLHLFLLLVWQLADFRDNFKGAHSLKNESISADGGKFNQRFVTSTSTNGSSPGRRL